VGRAWRRGEGAGAVEAMRRRRPRTRGQLSAYVRAFLGLRVPDVQLCEGHESPMDYLAYAVLGEEKRQDRQASATGRARDIVVWANRGGGKTQLGAVATLLECVFAAGCQVRILGGSEEQSRRMYEYLRRALAGLFGRELAGGMTRQGCAFGNGSGVQVLAQSERSVRGHHVPRLRCDEVEEFDREVWQAAQLITQSQAGLGGRVEAFSTMHRPAGLMSELVGEAGAGRWRLFRWCLFEVIERCAGRTCSQCGLWSDCGGRARRAEGYYGIEDALAQRRRVSVHTWQAEMLCRRPSLAEAVFGEFDPAVHVRAAAYDANLPLYRAIDFGYSNPLACLWLQTQGGAVFVLDEHLRARQTLGEHARQILARWPQMVSATYCDPAGRQRHEITGSSAVAELAALGIPARSRWSGVLEGINLIRDFLAPAGGPPRLFIDPKCQHLIAAFAGLRYQRQASGALSEVPEKDGVHDHVIDALRYFFVNRFGRKHPLREVRY